MIKTVLCMTAVAALATSAPALAQTAAPDAMAQPGATTPPAGAAPADAAPPAATTATPAAPAAPAASATTTAPATPAAGAAAPTTGAPGQGLTPNLPVKDNTGVAIGSIKEIKDDAGGKKLVTITMGTDSFAVAAEALVVQNGAAVINLTQAQLQAMVKKPAT
jgi:hypothetical protein